MRNQIWRRLAAACAAVVVGVAVVPFLSANPAAAYEPEDLTFRFAVVDTTSTHGCRRIDGDLPVTKRTNDCYLNDPYDDTFFKWDAGGAAFKVEVRNAGAYVAKFEFHPVDEKLWIYDTANDDDTIYVTLQLFDANLVPQGWLGPYGVPGTSAVVDLRVVDLEIAEGWNIDFYFCDDSARPCNFPFQFLGWAIA